MAHLFTSKRYRLLFSASAISNLGDGVSSLAFPWLATLLTRDPMLIALVAAATRLPWLLFSIPAGVWTDRRDRRKLMVQADLVRFALTGCVVAVTLTLPATPQDIGPSGGLPYIYALAALAFLLGSAEVLRDNAAQTILPSVVSKEQLEQANGQLWSIEQIMGAFIGPPLAGVLIAYAVPAPFLLDTATFALAAALVWCITLSADTPRTSPSRSWIYEAREGGHWLWHHREILQLALMLGCLNACNAMTLTVLPLFGQELLGLSAAQYGVLITAEAAGGVIGGLICPMIVAYVGGRRALMLALPTMACGWGLIMFWPTPWIVAPGLFLGMFAGLLWNVVTVSYRQRRIPDALLGRVNSLYRFFGWGALPVGSLIGGALVSLGETNLGREMALRLPFAVAACGALALWCYAILCLKLKDTP